MGFGLDSNAMLQLTITGYSLQKTRYSSVSSYCVDQLWTLAMIAKFNALDASLRLGKGEDWRGDLTLASFYPQISSKLTDISHKLT